MNRLRKVHVKSFGCQMNVYDSHRMADTLAPEGYVETQLPAEADLIILNTCHIREKAVDKVYSEIGRMREHGGQAARREVGLLARTQPEAPAKARALQRREQVVQVSHRCGVDQASARGRRSSASAHRPRGSASAAKPAR